MEKIRTSFSTAITSLAMMAFITGSATAQTQSTDDAAAPAAVTITPFVSVGSPYSSRIGGAIAFPLNKTTSLEAEVGYRRQELNAVSAHLSLVRDLPSLGRIKPYLAAGIGLEEYGAPLPQPNGTVATIGKIALSVNAGGGVKVPVDETWGLRADARWFNGLGDQAGEHWRLFNGVTVKTGGR
jgi:hypothetical protein